MNNLFLTIQGQQPDIVYTDNIAVYRLEAEFNALGTEISTPITLNLRSFSDTTFSTYSVSGGSFIRTFVKVIGLNSGLTKTIEIQIS